VGDVAYKLDLPETSKIHPVVHVSLLKHALQAGIEASPQLPPSVDVLQAIQGPAQILARRRVRKGNSMQEQVLVRWDGLPPQLATWEADQDLHQLYYLDSVWGHAALQARENVTTKTQARGV
jgi:hypothetical protein